MILGPLVLMPKWIPTHFFIVGFLIGATLGFLGVPFAECRKMGYDGLDWTGKWCVQQQAGGRTSTPLGVARVNYYVGINGPLERRER